MPIKESKIDTPNEQSIERILHTKRYSLILNKRLCKNCEICSTVCPREAIKIIKTSKANGEEIQPPKIDFNTQKCSYCGICEPICPFGAIQIHVNNEHVVPVIEKESFANLIREIEVDTSKCEAGCIDCEKACPLDLIKVTLLTPEGQVLKTEETKTPLQQGSSKVKIDINKSLCPGCRLCEIKCKRSAIHVRKIMHGLLNVSSEKCPPRCQECIDACPIPSTLILDGHGKVHSNETFCVFCGACKLVCPVEGALIMNRKTIYHKPVSSGAWNIALEKLTSTNEYSKETKTKGTMKIQKVVEKRLVLAKEAQT